MANLTQGQFNNSVVAKFSDHNTRITAAQQAADRATAQAASALQGVNMPDGTTLPVTNGFVSLPSSALAGLSVDPSTGLAQVTGSTGASTAGGVTAIAAIAAPNIVQPL